MEEKAPLEEKMSLGLTGMPVCFSCGRQGHGVNRCSQMNTSFPFLPPGWSVDVRNGQYRATRTERTGLGSPPGNEGWSGREGHWEASPRRIVNGMIESVWTALKGCCGVGANWCRSLQSRWMEAPGRWFPEVQSSKEWEGDAAGRRESAMSSWDEE